MTQLITRVHFKPKDSPAFSIRVCSGDRQALRRLFAKAGMILSAEAERQIFEQVDRAGVAAIEGFEIADHQPAKHCPTPDP